MKQTSETNTVKIHEMQSELDALIVPNFIGFLVFTLIPIVFAFALAFMEWDGSNAIKFVAFNNFKKMISDTFSWLPLRIPHTCQNHAAIVKACPALTDDLYLCEYLE